MANPLSSLIAFALACLELAGTSLAERVGAIPSGPDYDLAIPRQSDPSEALVTALIAEAKPCQIRPCTEVCRTETKRRRGSAVTYEVTTCAPEQSCIEDNAKCAKSISDQQKATTRDLVNRVLDRVVTSPSPLAVRRKILSPGEKSCYLAYCNGHTDLKNEFCGGGTCTSDSEYSSCKNHWNNHGKAEGRSFNPEVCTSAPGQAPAAPATLLTPAPIDGNSHCPTGFGSPGLERHTADKNHGDICRSANYSGVPTDEKPCYLAYCNGHTDLKDAFCGGDTCTSDSQYSSCKNHWNNNGKTEGRSSNPEVCTSEANGGWACPASCVKSYSAPWCQRSASSSLPALPCRVPRSYLPKRCVNPAFYEVEYSPNWWDRSKCNRTASPVLYNMCRASARTFQDVDIVSCANIVKTPKYKTGKMAWQSLAQGFVWSPSKKTCKTNPYDSEAGAGDEVYCVKRQNVVFTQGEVLDFGDVLSRPTWMTLQRCSSIGCVPCDKAQEGCFYEPGIMSQGVLRPGNNYALNVTANTDLRESAITVTLKCLAGEPINVEVRVETINNGDVTIYFNGVLQNFSASVQNYSADGLKNAGLGFLGLGFSV